MEPEKYVNDFNKECYKHVVPETLLSSLEFHRARTSDTDDTSSALHTNLGSLTVLDRLTGFGHRDIETGYRDPDGKFWLASGNVDIRRYNKFTMQEAIAFVKKFANTCVGV